MAGLILRLGLATQPGLNPATFLGQQPDDLLEFRFHPAHFVFDDFAEGDVGRAEIAHVGDEGTAHRPAIGIDLPYATGHDIDEHGGVAHFFKGQFYKVCIHVFLGTDCGRFNAGGKRVANMTWLLLTITIVG